MSAVNVEILGTKGVWLRHYVSLCKSFARYAPEYAAIHNQYGFDGEHGEISNLICKRIRQMPYDKRYPNPLDNPEFIDMGFDGDLMLEAGDVFHYTCLHLPEELLVECAQSYENGSKERKRPARRDGDVIGRSLSTIRFSMAVISLAIGLGRSSERVVKHFAYLCFALEDLTGGDVFEIASMNIDKLSKRYKKGEIIDARIVGIAEITTKAES